MAELQEQLQEQCPGCGERSVRQIVNEFYEPEWHAVGWTDEDGEPTYICFCPFCGHQLADPATSPMRVRVKALFQR